MKQPHPALIMPRLSNAREDILRSASSLFWFNSYESVGVEAICREARVNKGSFYHFFPSKEDVAYCLLDKFHREAVENLLAPAFRNDLPPLARFDRFLQLLEAHAAESRRSPDAKGHYPGCPIGNMVLELSTQSERLRQKLDTIIGCYIHAFATTIEDARQARQLPAATNALQMAELFAAAWQGGILIAKAHNEPELCVRVFRQVLECTFGEPLPRR